MTLDGPPIEELRLDCYRFPTEQQPEQGLAHEADDVRGDHDLLSSEPIGPDAAGAEEAHLPEDAREQDDAEIGDRTRQVEDGERDRDRDEEVAHGRDHLRDEHAAEVAEAEERQDHGAPGSWRRAQRPRRPLRVLHDAAPSSA